MRQRIALWWLDVLCALLGHDPMPSMFYGRAAIRCARCGDRTGWFSA
jgi:hypothetical protein